MATRSSMETTKTDITQSTASLLSSSSSTKLPSKAKQIWSAVKKHAKEHHESVNNAYVYYYGQGQMVKPGTTAVPDTKRT